MSYTIEIVPCKLAHMRELANNLRAGDAEEVSVVGRPCRHVLQTLWRNSYVRRVALIDGRVAAAWGCTGDMLSSEGEPWLLTTPVVEKAPVSFLRHARREVAEMLKDRPTLVSSVAADYTKAVKFLRRLGFTIGEPQAVGSQAFMFCEIRKGR